MKKTYLCPDSRSERISKLKEKIERDFPGFSYQCDKELRLFENLVEDLEFGRKPVTIRFKPGVVRMPFSLVGLSKNTMEVYQTIKDSKEMKYKGYVVIPKFVIAHAKDFPEHLARLDGFKDWEDMMAGMNDIYEPIYGRGISEEDVLSCYFLSDFHPAIE
jgi:hypothetical protein